MGKKFSHPGPYHLFSRKEGKYTIQNIKLILLFIEICKIFDMFEFISFTSS